MQRTITLNDKEQKRLQVLNAVMSGKLIARKAAELLELGVRQFRRLIRNYRAKGAAALVHGNRGRSPKHKTPGKIHQRVVQLAKSIYRDCNHQHLSELLEERDGIRLSRSSIRRILQSVGMDSPRKKRRPKHYRRRERFPQEGMLVQIDGSKHHWFGRRRPPVTLLTAIDDATGKVLAAVFRNQEDAHGYFLLLRQLVEQYGRPLKVYRDRHGIFESRSRKQGLDEQLTGQRDPTQFGRLLKELAVGSIPAWTPQAKGRIERLFETFQDRLVIELRLAEVNSIEGGNQFLPNYRSRYNRRFAVPAADSTVAYRPIPTTWNLDTMFCFKYRRTVADDNTVRLGEYRLQLAADDYRANYARAHVQIQERLDGSLAVFYQDRCLVTTPAPMEAPVLRTRKGRWPTQPPQPSTPSRPLSVKPRKTAAVATTKHPWRRSYKTMLTEEARMEPADFWLATGVPRRSPI